MEINLYTNLSMLSSGRMFNLAVCSFFRSASQSRGRPNHRDGDAGE